jgi:antitoxin (DNA-binding transcriptional repressor) of toxin-antitoxin stability system
MQAAKVGIREFRENLATYLESKVPVAITRHGSTIGVFVPTHQNATEADLQAFRMAVQKVSELIASAGISEEELLADLKERRRKRRG